MNKFLASLEITFRRDPTNFRPRVNKLNSVKDKEQKGLCLTDPCDRPNSLLFSFGQLLLPRGMNPFGPHATICMMDAWHSGTRRGRLVDGRMSLKDLEWFSE